jgi:O-antigen/teichoic acid export membrane protein
VLGTGILLRRFGIPLKKLNDIINISKSLVSFGWPLALSSNIMLLMNNIDILMISSLTSVQSAGLYKVFRPIGRLVLLPLISFNFLYLPIVTKYYDRGEHEAAGQIFATTSKWISLITFPLAITIVLFSKSILQIAYVSEYLTAATAFSVYTLGVLTRVLVGPNREMVEAIGRTRVDLLSASVGLIANVSLNSILIPQFSIVGAAVATGLGFVVYNVVETGYVYYKTGVQPLSLDTLKPIVVTATVGGLVRQFILEGTVGLLELIVFGLAITLVELIALVGTRSIDDRDMFLLRRVADQMNVDLE